jgi:hypothetical protein
MVVAYLNIMGVAVIPTETNSPSLIQADAVLSFSISPKPLKPIAGREGQVIYILHGVNQEQFVMRPRPNIRRKVFGTLAVEYPLCVLVRKAFNHVFVLIVLRNA